jgi:hypothetical protein
VVEVVDNADAAVFPISAIESKEEDEDDEEAEGTGTDDVWSEVDEEVVEVVDNADVAGPSGTVVGSGGGGAAATAAAAVRALRLPFPPVSAGSITSAAASSGGDGAPAAADSFLFRPPERLCSAFETPVVGNPAQTGHSLRKGKLSNNLQLSSNAVNTISTYLF